MKQSKKNFGIVSKLEKRDQRKLVRLLLSSLNSTVLQVKDGGHVTAEISIDAVEEDYIKDI